MADVRIEHTYNCSVDTLWEKIFFDPDYNDRLFKEALKFPAYEQIAFNDTGSEIRRSVEVTPELGAMPGPLKKLVGDGLGYREDGVFNKETKRYKITIVPNKMADKVTITGEMWAEPLGDNQCKRVFTCTITAKIFAVGGMLENKTIDDMKKSYEIGAQFTNKYIAEKGL